MDVTCTLVDLQQAAKDLKKAINAKSRLPILNSVLITAHKDEQSLSLLATDLEITLQITLTAKVYEEGSTLIPGSYFVEWLGLNETSPTIVIQQNNADPKERPVFKGYDAWDKHVMTTRWKPFDQEEFPLAFTPSQEEDRRTIPAVEIPTKLFEQTLKDVLPLVGPSQKYGSDSTRENVQVSISPGTITMHACDGYSIARSSQRLPCFQPVEWKVFLHASILKKLKDILPESETLFIQYSPSHQFFYLSTPDQRFMLLLRTSEVSVVTQEKNAATFKDLLETTRARSLQVNRNILLKMLTRIKKLSRKEGNEMGIRLVTQDTKLRLTGRIPKDGAEDSEEECFIDLNGHIDPYLLSLEHLHTIVNTIKGNTISMGWSLDPEVEHITIKPIIPNGTIYVLNGKDEVKAERELAEKKAQDEKRRKEWDEEKARKEAEGRSLYEQKYAPDVPLEPVPEPEPEPVVSEVVEGIEEEEPEPEPEPEPDPEPEEQEEELTPYEKMRLRQIQAAAEIAEILADLVLVA